MQQKLITVFTSLLAIVLLSACGGAAATSSAPVAQQPTTAAPAATEAPIATEETPAYVTYSDQDGYISAEVPGDWTIATDTSTENLISDVIGSPAHDALVHVMIYDDGTTYSQAQAGEVALALLNSGYTDGAGDIEISKDEPQSDGSEDLTWTSSKSQFSGVTVFKASGHKVIFFSTIYRNEAESDYAETLDYVLSTLEFTN